MTNKVTATFSLDSEALPRYQCTIGSLWLGKRGVASYLSPCVIGRLDVE
jgi:hypothetical protein